jgi:hypothetical protein
VRWLISITAAIWVVRESALRLRLRRRRARTIRRDWRSLEVIQTAVVLGAVAAALAADRGAVGLGIFGLSHRGDRRLQPRTLLGGLGDEYAEYMRHTYRLIPGVW